MKSHRYVLSVVLLSLSTLAFAQHDMQKPVAQSDAQKSFDKMKTLAGSWEGHVTTVPPAARHRRQAHAGLAAGDLHGSHAHA